MKEKAEAVDKEKKFILQFQAEQMKKRDIVYNNSVKELILGTKEEDN